MRKDHLELKVGIVSFLALLLASTLIFVVEDLTLFPDDYALRVGFPDAELLLEGANVNMSGVKIGKVGAMYINLQPSEEQKVIIELQIFKQHLIPKGSQFRIASSGFFGTHYLRITPPEKVPQGGFEFIEPNHQVILQGDSTTNIEELLNKGKGALDRVQSILDHVNDVVGNPNTKTDIGAIVANFRESSESLTMTMNSLKVDFQTVSEDVLEVTSHLKFIMMARKQNLMNTLENFELVSGNLRDITSGNKERIEEILKKIDDITSAIEDDGQFKEAMARIRTNFVKVSESVVQLTGRAQDIIENPELESKLHGAIDSATNAASALADIKRDIYSIDTRFSTRALYSPTEGNFESSYYLDTTFKNRYLLKVGFENGDTSSGITQVHGGIHRHGYAFRAGISYDKFGLGIDRNFFENKIQIGLESYDLNDPIHRIFAKFRMNNHTSVMIRWDDLSGSDDDLRIGLHHTF